MSSKKAKGKRSKGVSIDHRSESSALLPGRRECDCEATKHDLVANCLSCGRIVCAQEGSGDCFTCGQLVLTRQERQLIMADNIQSQQLSTKKSSDQSMVRVGKGPKASTNVSNTGLKDIAAIFETNESLENAIKHKDRMLGFDQNSSVRTKVIDDENDYFSLTTQNWISNEKRKTISAKVEELHENKLKTNKKILIDLTDNSAKDYSEPVIQDFNARVEELNNESKLINDYQTIDAKQFIDGHNNQTLPYLVYMSNSSKTKNKLSEDLNTTKELIKSFNNTRVQDKELMTMTDEGMCLSVNQPFASLLVSGIKRFEGRNWYSAFRGRLWIRSNNKKPNEDEIKEVEKFYGFAGIKTFPDSYPTSALVGCVTVIDCLPFEEYKQRYPEGDTEANYIFVCEDPKQLIPSIELTNTGNKIYKLNKEMHSSAMERCRWSEEQLSN